MSKFSIKIMDKVFESNEEGMLDLNDIWRGCELPASKRPNEFSRYKRGRTLKSLGKLKKKTFKTTPINVLSYFIAGDEDATIEYCKWCNLSVDSHGVVLLSKRDESYFGELLLQIFPDMECQVPFKDGKYFVDFYIPSLDLKIEYDEKQHNNMYVEDTIRELEIGGSFFRVVQGKEVVALQTLNSYIKKVKPIERFYIVDNKYVFRSKREAYRFSISTNRDNIYIKGSVKAATRSECTFTRKVKFINTCGKYPNVYTELEELCTKEDSFNSQAPF